MSNGYCVICSGKFYWKKHRNGWHRYKLRDVIETTTADKLSKKDKVSIKDNNAKKKMLVEFIIQYSKMKMDDFDLIKKLLNA